MSYIFSRDEYIGKVNEAKELTIWSLVAEGILTFQQASDFLENYAIVDQGHESWGSRLLRKFKGPPKDYIKLRMAKIVNTWGEKVPAEVKSIDNKSNRFSVIENDDK